MSHTERLFSKAPTEGELSREARELVDHPPQLILAFDCWRSKSQRSQDLAKLTMQARSTLATAIYFSPLYRDRPKPKIACFAGAHLPFEKPGSCRVAEYLEKFGIPKENIILRSNTVTTRTDILELLAYAHTQGYDSVAIVTSDNHRVRTWQEWQNHFSDFLKKKRRVERGPIYRPRLYVFNPTSAETQKVLESYVEKMEPPTEQLVQDLKQGLAETDFDKFGGGFDETMATGLAHIPVRNLRLFLQNIAERRYLPHKLARIQQAQEAIRKARLDPTEILAQAMYLDEEAILTLNSRDVAFWLEQIAYRTRNLPTDTKDDLLAVANIFRQGDSLPAATDLRKVANFVIEKEGKPPGSIRPPAEQLANAAKLLEIAETLDSIAKPKPLS